MESLRSAVSANQKATSVISPAVERPSSSENPTSVPTANIRPLPSPHGGAFHHAGPSSSRTVAASSRQAATATVMGARHHPNRAGDRYEKSSLWQARKGITLSHLPFSKCKDGSSWSYRCYIHSLKDFLKDSFVSKSFAKHISQDFDPFFHLPPFSARETLASRRFVLSPRLLLLCHPPPHPPPRGRAVLLPK